MAVSGKRHLSLLFLACLFLSGPQLRANEPEVIKFSEDNITPLVQRQLQWEIPRRQWVFLNDGWSIRYPGSSDVIDVTTTPFAFLGGERLIFEKKFELRKSPGSNYGLHLGEINGEATVRLNGKTLHEGLWNYLPISLSPDESLFQDGENVLEIELSRENRRFGDVPGFSAINLPRIDTGVLNTVYLEIRPRSHILGVNTRGIVGDSAINVQGEVLFNRELPAAAGYRIQVAYVTDNRVFFNGFFGTSPGSDDRLTLPPWPTRENTAWQPEAPTRYWIEVAIDSAGQTLDRTRTPLALRRFSADGNGFRLNGEPLTINGVNYVFQNMGGSELFDPVLVRKDLEDIKKRGFNAIRVILHPLPELFYQICDEIGLLCFQDQPFVYWGKSSLNTSERFRRWQAYNNRLIYLANRYNSLAAAGMAFYLDNHASGQQRRVKTVVADAEKLPLATYTSSLLNSAAFQDSVDFHIVDIIDRRRFTEKITELKNGAGVGIALPGAYTRALTYRIDSTMVTSDLMQIQTMHQEATKMTTSPGHFIPTYSDYYLYLPALQNGGNGQLYLNETGLVSVERIARDRSGSNQNIQEFSSPANTGETTIREDRSAHSFLYILIGFLNLFIFLISYKRYRVFRQNLIYSIKKPHGFFVNLQERISIPIKQSLFLLLVIAVNGAIIYSSLAYFYRSHLLFDYLLSIFFYTPWLKESVVGLIWNQPVFIMLTTLAIIIGYYLLAFLVKLISLTGEGRVLYNQALAATIWASSPLVFILPLGIVLYRMLLELNSYWILLGILLYCHVWAYLRWVNGTRVLIDSLYWKVFLLLTLLLGGGIALFGYFYQDYYHVREHLDFVYQLYQTNIAGR